VIGLIFFIIGMTIRLVALKQSGIKNYWRIYPQKICTTGLYSVVRHPMYLGSLLTMFGFFLMLVGINTAVCLEYVVFCFLMDRIDREEQILTGFFGDEYIRYANDTKALIPFIF
jgi:protein-S-isoprenylcysteine O-methyltransferase